MLYTTEQQQALESQIAENFQAFEREIIESICGELTDEQKHALKTLVLWYFHGDSSYHLFSGSAGVGKSFVVGRLVQCLRKIAQNRDIKFTAVCTAPTNKAVGVIYDIFNDKSLGYVPVIGTLHSMLHLRPGGVDADGKRKMEVKINTYRDHFSAFTLGIVDEKSMLTEELLSFVELNKGSRQKVLFVGDKFQLPPVEDIDDGEILKEEFQVSPVYERGYPSVNLVTPVRYAGKIAQFARVLREHIEHQILLSGIRKVLAGDWDVDLLVHDLKKEFIFNDMNVLNSECIDALKTIQGEDLTEFLENFIATKSDNSLPFPKEISDDSNIVTMSGSDWQELLEEKMESAPDQTRAIAWTNNRINSIANSLKMRIYGNLKYQVGERVMAKEPVVIGKREGIKVKKEVILQTCQEATIIAIKTKLETFTSPTTGNQLEQEFITLTIQKDDGQCHDVTTICPENIQEMREFFNLERKEIPQGDKKAWAQYYEMCEFLNVSRKGNTHILRLAYAGCLTINTSQGSGYSEIFVDWFNVYGCQNYAHRLRLAYTAITRAKSKIYVLCEKESYDFFSKNTKTRTNYYANPELNKWML